MDLLCRTVLSPSSYCLLTLFHSNDYKFHWIGFQKIVQIYLLNFGIIVLKLRAVARRKLMGINV